MFGRGSSGKGGKGRGGRGQRPRECICPECRTIAMHKRGVPCFQMKCPKCGAPMMGRLAAREDS